MAPMPGWFSDASIRASGSKRAQQWDRARKHWADLHRHVLSCVSRAGRLAVPRRRAVRQCRRPRPAGRPPGPNRAGRRPARWCLSPGWSGTAEPPSHRRGATRLRAADSTVGAACLAQKRRPFALLARQRGVWQMPLWTRRPELRTNHTSALTFLLNRERARRPRMARGLTVSDVRRPSNPDAGEVTVLLRAWRAGRRRGIHRKCRESFIGSCGSRRLSTIRRQRTGDLLSDDSARPRMVAVGLANAHRSTGESASIRISRRAMRCALRDLPAQAGEARRGESPHVPLS